MDINLKSQWGIVGLVFFTLFAAWILRVLYDGFTGSLSKVPGPFVSRFTHWVLKYYVITGQRMRYIHDLHQKYGPVVRLSPAEASIVDLTATKEIHSIGHGFNKSNFYPEFVKTEASSLFTMTDPKEHSARRRLLGNELSETSLQKHEKLVLERASFAVDAMVRDAAHNGFVDILKWWTFMATDIIAELSFGESFKMLELGQDNQFTTDLKMFTFFEAMRYEFDLAINMLVKLPIPAVRDIIKTHERLISSARARIERYKSLPDPPPTLFSKLWRSGEAGTLTETQIRSEARVYIVAGSDTTAVTLTYLVWVVSQHPDVQKSLVAEVSSLREGFGYSDVKHLPLLNNVITETLRLYGAAPGSLPRTVPDGGRTLAGYYLPAGITASTQAFTLQRNPKIFPDPESFQPTRWEKPTADMKTAMLPFGGGSRNCIGINLAYMELRFAVAQFYRKAPMARISKKAGKSDMELRSFFLLSPKARRCLMDF